MASKPRILTQRQRDEIAAAIRPLVDRFSDRYGVPASAILAVVQRAGVRSLRSSLPANFVPANPAIARMIAALHAETGLSPASIAEDSFDRAVEVRDALVYAARNHVELPYETIGASLGGLNHDAVMDCYCRAIGRIENEDRAFGALVRVALTPLRKK